MEKAQLERTDCLVLLQLTFNEGAKQLSIADSSSTPEWTACHMLSQTVRTFEQ